MFTIMQRRLQQFLELENITSSRLADVLGIQRSGISHILSGRNKPGYDFILKFSNAFPNISLEWLINGKGKPYKEKETTSPLSSTSDYKEDVLDFSAIEEPDQNLEGEEILAINTQSAVNKSISRITVFFSDGSFEEFYSNKKH